MNAAVRRKKRLRAPQARRQRESWRPARLGPQPRAAQERPFTVAPTWGTLLRSLPDVVVAVDRRGTILSTNRSSHGLPLAQRFGGTLFDLILREDHEALRASLAQVFTGGRPARFEGRVLGPAGATTWYEFRVAGLARRGRATSAALIATDISDRKRAELALAGAYQEADSISRKRTRALLQVNDQLKRENEERRQAEQELRTIEERYRALVENMPAMAYLAEADELGATVYIGPQIGNLTGFSQEEWTADPAMWSRRLHPEDRERVLAEWAESVRTGAAFGTKYRLLTKDGRVIWWRDEAQPVHDVSGRVLLHGMIRDVTTEETEAEKRREAEQALRISLDRSQRLFAVTAAVNRGADAGDVHELVLDALVHGIGADRASILLADAAGVMSLVAWRGLSDPYRRAVEGHSPWTPEVRDPEPVVVADVAGEPGLGPLRETLLAEGIRALALVPIFKDRLLGNFMLCYDAPHPPDAEEIQFALTMARHIGLATQRDRDERALQASHNTMQRLAEHLQKAREEERARIAREVHDELGQTLTALKLDLAWLKGSLVRRFELAQRIAEAAGLADAAIQTVRRIATALRPGVLDNLGLAPAVEWLGHDIEARTGIRCHFDARFEELVGEPEAATQIFRLFQEALTNVIRHSGASDVGLKLAREGTELIGEIRDNGRGISKLQASDPKALGLIGMRERARLLGGEIEFDPDPAGGTIVRFRCPLRGAKPQEA